MSIQDLIGVPPLRVEGCGYVDHIGLCADPKRRGYPMVVWREYKRVREGLDRQQKEPWVRFRQALQGME